MLKLFTFWNRRLDLTHDDAIERWKEHAPKVVEALGDRCSKYLLNVGGAADFTQATADVGAWPEMAPPYDGIAEAFLDCDSPDEALTLVAERTADLVEDERSFVGQQYQMVTDETMQVDLGRRYRGVKFFVMLTRRPDQTHDQCAEYWLSNHGPLVVRLFGSQIARYSINIGQQADYTGWSPSESPPYDGLAEFSFDCSFAELREMISKDEAEVIADEHEFIGTYRIIHVDEIEVGVGVAAA